MPDWTAWVKALASAGVGLGVALAYACSSDSPPPASAAAPSVVQVSMSIPGCGGARVLAPGATAQLTVVARDGKGAPMGGTTVLFAAPEQGASGTFASPDALGAMYARVTTDGSGSATAAFTAGAVDGVFLVDAFVLDGSGEATFAITDTSDPVAAKASPQAARCALEAMAPSDPSAQGEALVHGPVFLPAGAVVADATPVDDMPAPPTTMTAPAWFAWIDDHRAAGFEHDSRFVLLDPNDASAAPRVIPAAAWPAIAMPGNGQPSDFRPPWATSAAAAPAPLADLTAASRRVQGGLGILSLDAGAGEPPDCAVIVYGKPDDVLARNARDMASFFAKTLGVRTFFATSDGHTMIPTTSDEVYALLKSAANAHCKKVYLYVSSHGSPSELANFSTDGVKPWTGGIPWSVLARWLKEDFGDGMTEVVVIAEACFSGVGLEWLQGNGLDGEFIAAADRTRYAYNYGWASDTADSVFTGNLLESWRKTFATGKSLLDAFVDARGNTESSITNALHFTKPQNPQYARLLPTPPPMGDFRLCPGERKVVPLPLPQGLPAVQTSLQVPVTVEDRGVVIPDNKAIYEPATQQGRLGLEGVAPGTTRYRVAGWIDDTSLIVGGGTITVDATCGDAGGDAGGGCRKIATCAAGNCPWVAVDATNVYFYDGGSNVETCPKTGCTAAPVVLATTASAVSSTGGFFHDDSRVYFRATGGAQYTCSGGACVSAQATQYFPLQRAGRDGSNVYGDDGDPAAPQGLFYCPASGCAASGPALFFDTSGGATHTIQNAAIIAFANWVDPSTVTFLEGTGSATYAASCPGGRQCINETVLCQLPATAASWAVRADATTLYAASLGKVVSCPKSGGGPLTVYLSGSNTATILDVATDATDVYFADVNAGVVAACPRGGCGGAPRTIATTSYLDAVAVDATTVYYAAGGGVFACPSR